MTLLIFGVRITKKRVHPITYSVYFSVSKSEENEMSGWRSFQMPRDLLFYCMINRDQGVLLFFAHIAKR